MHAREWNQAETLYAFCGWLTVRSEPTVMSSHDDAAVVCERIAEFCKRHDLAEPRHGWEHAVVSDPGVTFSATPPPQEPS